jgi:hypothetical protein
MTWKVESGHHIGVWVAKELNRGYFAERSAAVGLVHDGEIFAGVIYEDWNGRSINCHFVANGRLTPAFVAAIFDYPFNVCGVEKAIVIVEETLKESLDIVQHMGFTEEARIKDAHPNGDLIILTLKKSDCRYLEPRYAERIGRREPVVV